MANFFVSCSLGFEQELVQEMREFWFEMMDLDGLPTRTQFPEKIEIDQGGVQINVPEHLGYQINFFSKLANRVLLRIAHFEARYYDQLEKSFEKIKWNNWFSDQQLSVGTQKEALIFQLKIETQKSRLNHEKNIAEAIANALKKQKINVADKSLQSLYVRIVKDKVLVSLDTSGDHLHRRGYAVYRGEAPLRETLAAFIVRQLKKHVTFNSEFLLVDPFVGSGTLLFESLSYCRPMLDRDYAWLHWGRVPKLFHSPTWKKNYRWIKSFESHQALGFDIDVKAIQNLNLNSEIFFKDHANFRNQLRAHVQDSQNLNLRSEEWSKSKNEGRLKSIWVIANPPYGERLSNPDQLAVKVLNQLSSQVNGMIVIHPLNWKFSMTGLKLASSEDFKNQGLSLKLSIFIKV